MAENVVCFLLERIGDLVLQESKFLYEVRDQVKLLQIELQLMRGFLRDADSRQEGDASIRQWVAEIRDLAYDADDIIDTFALKMDSESKNNCGLELYFKRLCRCGKKMKTLHDVGTKIVEIKTRISELTKIMDRYGIKKLQAGEGPSSSSTAVKTKLRRTYSHHVDHNVVGLVEPAKILVAQLLKDGREARDSSHVVSICGMGGLGKTTLARKVYHHDEIRDHFDHFIWVYISQQCQTRDTWEKILFKINPPDKEKRKEMLKKKDDEVAKELYEELRTKKCLVVLDDIWDSNTWSLLSDGFPTHEDTKTKILLTSRNKDVAYRADSRTFCYEPSCLNEKDSLELFQKIAIFKRMPVDSGHNPPDTSAAISSDAFITLESMKTLGEEMVRHCGGLPLAITVLGGLLATKYTIDDWDKVHKNIKSYLRSERQHLGLFEVLALSYDDLPYQLKPCFLHLGQFPEDFEVPRRRVINLWVAEDIISSESAREGDTEETLEDVAYRYLTELTERYMVQVEKRSSSGRIKSLRMHDLMRELCISKAKENNFFQIVELRDSNRKMDFFSSPMVNRPTSGRIRRLSIYLNNFSGSIPLGSEEFPPIRYALGFRLDKYSGMGQNLIESMIRNFKLLRVLDLEQIQGFCIPKNIGSLIHLRALTVSSAWIGVLSSSIGNLRFLLSLNLEPYDSARYIPDVIWKMKRLRHLYLPVDCGSDTLKLQFANLNDLQTLINFPASIADVNDLTTLTNLRKLVILIPDESHLSRFLGIFQPEIRSFNHLRSLSIKVGKQYGTVDHAKVVSCCPRLNKLKLNGDKIFQKYQNTVPAEDISSEPHLV